MGKLSSVTCPECGEKMPKWRIPRSMKQALWGGWTCPKCGCEIDKPDKLEAKKMEVEKEKDLPSTAYFILIIGGISLLIVGLKIFLLCLGIIIGLIYALLDSMDISKSSDFMTFLNSALEFVDKSFKWNISLTLILPLILGILCYIIYFTWGKKYK